MFGTTYNKCLTLGYFELLNLLDNAHGTLDHWTKLELVYMPIYFVVKKQLYVAR